MDSANHAQPTATSSHASVLDLIGETPVVVVQNIDTGPCQLFLKLESQNPGGSVKDRIALSMIETAEREELLRPGGTIIEATAGNTGLGLALVAAQKGLPPDPGDSGQDEPGKGRASSRAGRRGGYDPL